MLVPKISDADLLRLHSQNLTNRQIADRLQVSQPAVHYRLQKLGLANNCYEDENVTIELVEILHEKGLTNLGMALVLKTNVPTVTSCLTSLGLVDNYIKLRAVIEKRTKRRWR
jgi:orotate phosphoribosyltransferase-like protein